MWCPCVVPVIPTEVFPLQDPEANREDTDALMQKQIDILEVSPDSVLSMCCTCDTHWGIPSTGPWSQQGRYFISDHWKELFNQCWWCWFHITHYIPTCTILNIIQDQLPTMQILLFICSSTLNSTCSLRQSYEGYCFEWKNLAGFHQFLAKSKCSTHLNH